MDAEFKNVHTKIIERIRRKEPNLFTILNSARQSFLLMNTDHSIYYLECIFIYFADVIPFRSLLMIFLRHAVKKPGWACQHHTSLYFRLKNERKLRKGKSSREAGIPASVMPPSPSLPFPSCQQFNHFLWFEWMWGTLYKVQHGCSYLCTSGVPIKKPD